MTENSVGRPSMGDMDLSDGDKKMLGNPEAQKDAEKAERFEKFKPIARATIESYYENPPFGIPKEVAIGIVAERVFRNNESIDSRIDRNFLNEVQSVLDAVNQTEGGKTLLSMTAVTVIGYHLQVANGIDPSFDLSEVAFLADQMSKRYRKSTGQSLEHWARSQVQFENVGALDPKTYKEFFGIFDQDNFKHHLSPSNLSKIFEGYLRETGADSMSVTEAMPLLAEIGFVVPDVWEDGYSETGDGKIVIEACEKARTLLLVEEWTDTAVSSLENLSADDLHEKVFTVDDVLGIASASRAGTPASWEACDKSAKALVMKVIDNVALRFGGTISGKAGKYGPEVRFV